MTRKDLVVPESPYLSEGVTFLVIFIHIRNRIHP